MRTYSKLNRKNQGVCWFTRTQSFKEEGHPILPRQGFVGWPFFYLQSRRVQDKRQMSILKNLISTWINRLSERGMSHD